MRVQAMEEETHAMKFFDFIHERSGRVKLPAIEAPPIEWDSPLAIFKASYQHEQKVTGLINNLVSLACDQKDPASSIFLQWFVTEQVEEEASANEVVGKLELVGESPQGLLMLDKELAGRTFHPAPAER